MAALNSEVIRYIVKYRNATKGSVMFVWVLLMLPRLVDEPGSLFVWANAVLLLGQDLLAQSYRKIPDEYFDSSTAKIRRLFIFSSVFFSMHWGLLTGYIFYEPRLEAIHISAGLVLAFSTISGFTVWLLSPRAGQVCMVMLFLPSVVVMFMDGELAHMITGGFMIFCVIGLLHHGDVRSHYALETLAREIRFSEQASRYKKISQLDGLTGLHNRRHFDRYLPLLIDEARDENRVVSLLVVDLDHFKNINDKLGHDAGDKCLKFAAELLKREVRSSLDLLCRYGGEEFVIVMNGVDEKASVIIAERICQSFRDHPAEYDGKHIPWSTCVGISTLTDEVQHGNELFKQADEALYEAKGQGRDRAIHHQSLHVPRLKQA